MLACRFVSDGSGAQESEAVRGRALRLFVCRLGAVCHPQPFA